MGAVDGIGSTEVLLELPEEMDEALEAVDEDGAVILLEDGFPRLVVLAIVEFELCAITLETKIEHSNRPVDTIMAKILGIQRQAGTCSGLSTCWLSMNRSLSDRDPC